MNLRINIKKRTPKFSIDINTVKNTGIVGILGASGSGKSLFLKCLAGLESMDSGEIILDSKVLYNAKINLPPQQRNIAYLFQNYGLFPNMTVAKNIQICAKTKDINQIIAMFRLEHLLNIYPEKLSGGEQQRVAIARILASKPKVILLDEPFSALDARLRKDIEFDMIRLLSNFAGIVFIVSHDKDELYRFSQDIMIIHNGNVIEQGKKDKIYKHPIHLQTARLVGYDNIINAQMLNKKSNQCICVKSEDIKINEDGKNKAVVIECIEDIDNNIVYLQCNGEVIRAKDKRHYLKKQQVKFDLENYIVNDV
ncbi:hypothetical protein AN639_07345 [Candidatus Epulonipiscium fishelsonii]|uniref:Uncharacterized protein n=1 Tax=Candidatus Epulonipiscium fishelsonii TaxID=77094 RepID=A0ACC8XA25_9FIRM|nr:hypothetical protein AN639_07345 [Epulopiscium sp. SCG-B05WGA-EpuloA1]ONI39064.1 hypothetical protein AN396_09330 [Epulopiscium sp. SCG-B11WGA-EpuloA1]